MIVRKPLVCNSCEKKTVTRTRVGRDGVHPYRFPCPGCGIEIAFALKVDSQSVSAYHVDIKNARWCNSEQGAIKELIFEQEMPVPADLPEGVSPWITQAFNFRDLKAYGRDEALRRHWIESGWPMWLNLAVHFEKRNDALFDKTAQFDDSPRTWEQRLFELERLAERAFNFFTTDTPAERSRINQRIKLASSIAPELLKQLAEEYVASGRMASLWREIKNVRAQLVAAYASLSPLVQVSYWHEKYQDLCALSLSTKMFDELKHLFVDCFETVCRLLVIATAVEGIIDHGKPDLRAKKRTLTIWEFEALENANKRDFIKKYPIADLFVPVLDTNLRNGIGHHSARYDSERDEVIFYKAVDDKTREQRLPFTIFCDVCRHLFSAFELAVAYHHALHLLVSGRM